MVPYLSGQGPASILNSTDPFWRPLFFSHCHLSRQVGSWRGSPRPRPLVGTAGFLRRISPSRAWQRLPVHGGLFGRLPQFSGRPGQLPARASTACLLRLHTDLSIRAHTMHLVWSAARR